MEAGGRVDAARQWHAKCLFAWTRTRSPLSPSVLVLLSFSWQALFWPLKSPSGTILNLSRILLPHGRAPRPLQIQIFPYHGPFALRGRRILLLTFLLPEGISVGLQTPICLLPEEGKMLDRRPTGHKVHLTSHRRGGPETPKEGEVVSR